MRKWKLAFMASLGYARMTPQEVVASLAGLGYEAVEWTLLCGVRVVCLSRSCFKREHRGSGAIIHRTSSAVAQAPVEK